MADAKIKAEAEVVVDTSGIGAAVKKAVAKADEGARASRKTQTDEAAKAAKEQERVAKRRADAEQRLLDKQTREQKRAEDAHAREYERYQRRLSQMHHDEVHKRAQEEIASERKSMAARQKLWKDHWRNVRGLAGGMVGGALAGGAVAASSARGMVGIQDPASRYQNALDYKQRLARLSAQAGLDKDARARVNTSVSVAADASGKSQQELMGVLEAGQAKFNRVDFFEKNLEDIAVAATASGSDAKDLAVAMGYVQQAFNLTGDEAKEMMAVMVAAANAGSIEVADFATNFASVAGTFAQATGLTGAEGARQFIGTAQAAGTLGASAAETATLVQRLTQSFSRTDVQDKMKKHAGIDIQGKPVGAIIAELATSERFQKRGVAEKIFGKGDILAEQAREALVAAHERVKSGQVGAIDIDTIARVDPQKGRDAIASAMSAMEDEGLLKAQRQAIAVQQDTIDHFSLYNDQITAVAQATMDLESKFGDLGRTLGLWKDSVAATGLGGAAGSVLSGGRSEGGGILSTTLQTLGMGSVGAKLAPLLKKIPGLGKVGAAAGRVLPAMGRAMPWAARAGAALGPRALALAGPVGLAVAGGLAAYQLYDWLTDKGASDAPGGGVGGGPMTTAPLLPSTSTAAPGGAPKGVGVTAGDAAIVQELRKSTKLQEQLVARSPARPPAVGNGNRGSR